MKEEKNQGNNYIQKIYGLKDEQETCPSCNSTNVEVYIKNENLILECLDCGRKSLLD